MSVVAAVGLHGWLILDKPLGITSARAVAIIKRATGAKTGHAGTLDPLATGVLPLALGEATKTAQFISAERKEYRFRVRWGVATDTDDSEGAVTGESRYRPSIAQIEAMLPRFTGIIEQRPPAYSAIKIDGKRAYALARAGNTPEMRVRTVDVESLTLLHAGDHNFAHFHARVGEGTYIRSLARDIATALGTLGHVVDLRRTCVGRFTEGQAISLDSAVALGHGLAASEHLLPIETALDDIPALALSADESARLRQGQRIAPHDDIRRARLAEIGQGEIVGAKHNHLLVGLVRIEDGALRPVRIINR